MKGGDYRRRTMRRATPATDATVGCMTAVAQPTTFAVRTTAVATLGGTAVHKPRQTGHGSRKSLQTLPVTDARERISIGTRNLQSWGDNRPGCATTEEWGALQATGEGVI